MTTDPNDRPVDPTLSYQPRPDAPKADPVPLIREPGSDAPMADPVSVSDEMADGVPLDTEPLDGEPATGPGAGESVASAIDGASRPDRVAIAMLVGIVVLLVICVAFAYAAR